MFSWSSYILVFIVSILLVSCSSNIKLDKKKELSYYLVELGDREFAIGNYKQSLKYYYQSFRKDKELLKNVYMLSRIIKSAIKLENRLEVQKYVELLKSLKPNQLDSEFKKEIYHYTLGKYFLFLKNKGQADLQFNQAKKLSKLKRNKFYNCLINTGRDCSNGPTL